MNAPSSILQTDHPWSFFLARLLSRFGVRPMVLATTAVIVLLSVVITSVSLSLFQGYIDALGIGICIAAPVLIFPLPAKIFFTMFLRLQQIEEELRIRNLELEQALCEVKTLSGFLPICSSCKNIRDDAGYWNDIEEYISSHSDLQLTHAICPNCVERLYPELGIQTRNAENPENRESCPPEERQQTGRKPRPVTAAAKTEPSFRDFPPERHTRRGR